MLNDRECFKHIAFALELDSINGFVCGDGKRPSSPQLKFDVATPV